MSDSLPIRILQEAADFRGKRGVHATHIYIRADAYIQLLNELPPYASGEVALLKEICGLKIIPGPMPENAKDKEFFVT